jgi:hypothetical protein
MLGAGSSWGASLLTLTCKRERQKTTARLRERGGEHQCVIMCADAVWWRCHRRIITDHLLAAGEQVMHILGKSHIDVASLTPGAVVRKDRTVVYPA